MNLGQIATRVLPILIVAGLAYFVYASTKRQRIAVLLAWLFPGLGHFWLGYKSRALAFGLTLTLLFVAGMALADFANISPFDRHPVWGYAQFPGGLLTGIAYLLTLGVQLTRDNPFYQVGCLYTGCACLLNILAMNDAWDLAGKPLPGEVAPNSPEAKESKPC